MCLDPVSAPCRFLGRLGAGPRCPLTTGMIDFHVHTYPDNFERTVSAVDAARGARDRGLKAIVLKGGAFETVTRAAEANAAVPGGVFLGPQSSVPRFQAWRGATVEQMAAAIKAVGAPNCVLASDMGAAPLDPPINGFVAFVKRLGELGVSDAELDQMTRKNPSALLGI